MYAKPLSSELGCWGRRFACCKCWEERTEEQLEVHVSTRTNRDRHRKNKLTINTVVLGRVADDGVATAGRQAVLAVNLVLAAILAGRSSPDVDVRLAVLPVRVCDKRFRQLFVSQENKK